MMYSNGRCDVKKYRDDRCDVSLSMVGVGVYLIVLQIMVTVSAIYWKL